MIEDHVADGRARQWVGFVGDGLVCDEHRLELGLLLEANATLTPVQLRQAIRWGTSGPVNFPRWSDYFETGVHDATAAVARSSSTNSSAWRYSSFVWKVTTDRFGVSERRRRPVASSPLVG